MSAIPYSDDDIAYVTGAFVELDDLCRVEGLDPSEIYGHIAAGRLPRATYVLPDGRELVPDTYFRLAAEAGGPGRLRNAFIERYTAAATIEDVPSDPEGEWQAYLSGEYGVCLYDVNPESIVRKTALMTRIDALIDAPARSADWAAELRSAVDELDELERPFAPHYDRIRFGQPSSRDRLITAVRERYPDVFEIAAPRAEG